MFNSLDTAWKHSNAGGSSVYIQVQDYSALQWKHMALMCQEMTPAERRNGPDQDTRMGMTALPRTTGPPFFI